MRIGKNVFVAFSFSRSSRKKGIFVQSNLITSLLKGHFVSQLTMIPEYLNPFKTPLAPLHQTFSQFILRSAILKIDGHKIQSTNDLLVEDGKEGKFGFVIPRDIHDCLHHVNTSLSW